MLSSTQFCMQFVSAYEAKTSCYQVVIDSATCNTQDQFVFVNNIAIHNIIYDGDIENIYKLIIVIVSVTLLRLLTICNTYTLGPKC